jgi:hypothetical protein
MKIEKIKKTIAFDVINLIKEKPKLFFMTLVFDLVFWGAVTALYFLSVLITPKLNQDIFSSFLFLILYSLTIILTYSSTKLHALNYVESMFKKNMSKLANLRAFLSLNLLVGVIFLIVLLFFGLIIKFMRPEIVGVAQIVIQAITLIVAFSFIGVTHTLFVLTMQVKDTLSGCFKITFTKIKKYYPIVLINISLLLIILAIYNFIGNFLNKLFVLNVKRYSLFFSIIFIIFIILMHAYNRVYFYLVVKEIKI